jgi:hypothetical protein
LCSVTAIFGEIHFEDLILIELFCVNAVLTNAYLIRLVLFVDSQESVYFLLELVVFSNYPIELRELLNSPFGLWILIIPGVGTVKTLRTSGGAMANGPKHINIGK